MTVRTIRSIMDKLGWVWRTRYVFYTMLQKMNIGTLYSLYW